MRVMLIEDDGIVRETILSVLEAEGMEVEGLANAEDAVVLFGAGQVPNVLVADVNLGAGLTGFDLAAIARERHPKVGVVLISGMAFDDSASRSFQRRRERFLRKPFAPEILSQTIREAAADAAARTCPQSSEVGTENVKRQNI